MIIRRLINLPETRPGYAMAEPEWLKREMDPLFGRHTESPAGSMTAGVFPLINLTENKDGYILRAELPGMKSENLDISIDGNNLMISGERKIAFNGENARYATQRNAAEGENRGYLPGRADETGNRFHAGRRHF